MSPRPETADLARRIDEAAARNGIDTTLWPSRMHPAKAFAEAMAVWLEASLLLVQPINPFAIEGRIRRVERLQRRVAMFEQAL